jgi:PilZ domain
VCAVRNVVGGALHLGQSEDLGPGGITLRRPRDVPVLPQTIISLTFDLPGTRTTIDVNGFVVSDRRHGSFRRTGVRFVKPSAEQLALLSEFCRRRKS